MTLELKGDPSRNRYVYVNFLVDLTCDRTPVPATATLKQIRERRRTGSVRGTHFGIEGSQMRIAVVANTAW